MSSEKGLLKSRKRSQLGRTDCSRKGLAIDQILGSIRSAFQNAWPKFWSLTKKSEIGKRQKCAKSRDNDFHES